MSDTPFLIEKCREAGAELPMGESLAALAQPLSFGNLKVPNRLACQPMEGADGLPDGSPGELTLRRYRRFAEGGAGLIWVEAIATVETGRGNPGHLWLHRENAGRFAAMVEMMREAALRACGREIAVVAQLTHAGRYSKPFGPPLPVIACNNPHYEKDRPVSPDRIITDDGLRRLEDDFERAAKLAFGAGFDGVDVKACHRYLTSELLSAFGREGAYGGGFENRTRYFRNCVARARAVCPEGRFVTARMNAYDGVPNPFGWGQDGDDHLKADLTEPLKLIGEMREGGMELLNITMGNPYVNPHVNRPFRRGGYEPPEHPLKGVERILQGAGAVQKAFPGMAVVASGLSYLGPAADIVAAGLVERGMASVAGFGRTAFAYPDFARDILSGDGMQKGKSCLACTKCTELMRAGAFAGCPVRDQETYLPLYRKRCIHKEG
jgi:2,4-dienoyl-CoA reductase-like NADH-dependent reductase (Old Yellow Enzyme family)